MRTVAIVAIVLLPFGFFAACSATDEGHWFNEGGSSPTGVGAGGSTGIGGMDFDGGELDSGPQYPPCESDDPNDDFDGDGFTENQGDCNDCDENVNPNAIEVIATEPLEDGGIPPAVDEDCDGEIDNVPQPCDDSIGLELMDPFDGARAVELCKMAENATDWGVVTAEWVLPDGNPGSGAPNFDLGHGAVTAFGQNVNVQAGSRMLALSSGTARQPTDPGYSSVSGFSKGYTCGHPYGFPKESPACPGVTTGTPHDGVALQLTIRVPSNAQGFSFDFDFYTYEWPGYICSQYNDFFVALLEPFPTGQQDGNISFDSQGNPVSVNNAFLEVCGCSGGPPCSAGGKSFPCALGDAELLGTGFGTDSGTWHGATSWLYTTAPLESEEITIRWGVYDSGDGILDSTTLIDNWQWIATPGTQVGTEPVPAPR